MSNLTDPARELADICNRLRNKDESSPGSQVLASIFEVSGWSVEFYELVFTILKRIDQLKLIVGSLADVDLDIRDQAIVHLDTIARAFSQEGLNNQWKHASTHLISPEHVNPIRMLSSEVRRVHPLPQLTADDLKELVASVDELLGWLREHQINEQDFIRQAIIEGLEGFRFRVERVSWVGWGYTLDSLRNVIGAYLALDRGIDPTQQPDGKAVLLKVEALLKIVFEKVGVVKDTFEKTNWLIEGYKNISAAVIAHKGVVALIGVAVGGSG